MKGDRVCIFGYDGELNPIRPSLPGGIHENYLYIDGKFLIRPFAHIEFDFNNKVSHPPHTEDYYIDRGSKPEFYGFISPQVMEILLEKTAHKSLSDLFGAEIYDNTHILPGHGNRSLETVKVDKIDSVFFGQNYDNSLFYRIKFTDSDGIEYNLPVTDCAFRNYCNQIDSIENNFITVARNLEKNLDTEVYLRLGLTREFKNKLWIQVSGIYSFPDYRI